jgi:hypothetical protein
MELPLHHLNASVLCTCNDDVGLDVSRCTLLPIQLCAIIEQVPHTAKDMYSEGMAKHNMRMAKHMYSEGSCGATGMWHWHIQAAFNHPGAL